MPETIKPEHEQSYFYTKAMIYSTPWDDIQQPNTDYNVRIINTDGLIPVYWGKDVHGHCLLVAELDGDHQEAFLKANMNVQGIDIDLRQRPGTLTQILVITLVSNINLDLFHALCNTLIRSLSNTSDSRTALTITLNQLKRWQRFLAGERPQLLSPAEVRGLFAELYFLRSLYTNKLSQSDALDAWIGPKGGNQDFVFDNTAVEIKTISNKGPNLVHISSEDQLESPAEHLFLTVERIIESTELPAALSLNEMAQRIESDLIESPALEEYQIKLATAGYAELQQYDSPSFQVAETCVYRVTGKFPRIVRSELPGGLQNVRYKLQIDAAEPFVCPLETIWSANECK